MKGEGMSFGYRSRHDGVSPAQGTAARENALAPGRRTLTESLPPQPQTSGSSSDPDTARDTRREIDYPHRAQIESATGNPIPGRALVDPQACETRGVLAFADGEIAYFMRSNPELHVAAHEAAHLMQHAGLTSDAGLGAEGHAHAVAEAVTAGGSARGLVGARGDAVAPSIRDYTELDESEQNANGQWKVGGGDAHVGDQGRTVTTKSQGHVCYADPQLISESNAILEAKKSGIRIEAGAAGPSGDAPDGSGFKTTVRVNYTILSDDDNKTFVADCGRSAREVMGESGKDNKPHGLYSDDAGIERSTVASKDPADYRDEIFVQGGLGPDARSARAAYNALSVAEADAFDKKHKINKYAAPRVGEAFTRRRDDSLSDHGFNYHWGGVIMLAGGDRVTWENFTKGEPPDARDDKWFFATYGPPTKRRQTFHDRWSGVGGSGMGTTHTAATSADPAPFMSGAASTSTANLITRYHTASDAAEKMALEAEIRRRFLHVTVDVKRAQEGRDNVYVTAEHAGRRHRTGEAKMASGDKNTFFLSLDPLVPITGKITVRVCEADTLSDDDVISIIDFDAPYLARSDDRPWDDAKYHTTVEFDR